MTKKSVSRAAKVLGSRGGKKGGPARAEALTKTERVTIATKGGKARARQKERE